MQTLDIALQLDQQGILRQREYLPELAWLDESGRLFLLDIYLAGEGGLRARLVQKWAAKNEEGFLRMETDGLIHWETSGQGKPVAALLSWKGEAAIKLMLRAAAHQASGPAYVRPAVVADQPDAL